MIYQEPEIIPHVSVAENIYVGELPPGRTSSGAATWRTGTSRSCPVRVHARPAARHVGRATVSRAAAVGRDHARVDRRRTGDRLRRADLVAVRHRGRCACSRSSDGCATRASPCCTSRTGCQEIFAIADRVTVLRDGAVVGHQAGAGDDDGRARIDDGRPGPHRHVPPRTPSARRRRPAVRGLSSADVHDIEFRRARRRGPRDQPASSAPADPSSRMQSSGTSRAAPVTSRWRPERADPQPAGRRRAPASAWLPRSARPRRC